MTEMINSSCSTTFAVTWLMQAQSGDLSIGFPRFIVYLGNMRAAGVLLSILSTFALLVRFVQELVFAAISGNNSLAYFNKPPPPSSSSRVEIKAYDFYRLIRKSEF
ncbi:hypothetical protein ACFS4T_16340 [Pseudomonas lini]